MITVEPLNFTLSEDFLVLQSLFPRARNLDFKKGLQWKELEELDRDLKNLKVFSLSPLKAPPSRFFLVYSNYLQTST